jgi:glycine betaine catabolism B
VSGLLKTHRLIFQERHDVGGGVSSLAFRPGSPAGARAGQHGILRVGATAVKPFSLASAPEEDSVLIGTSLASGSAVKQRLAALQPGDAVTLHGPVNNFTLEGRPPGSSCSPRASGSRRCGRCWPMLRWTNSQ